MSLDFKLHYDRLREGDPTKPEAAAATSDDGTFYDEPSHARNLCVAWPDGKRQFLNYAYLVGGDFTPGEETNVITLYFSNNTVTLKGYRLEALFMALLDNLPKQLVVADARYVQAGDSERAIVKEVLITKAAL